MGQISDILTSDEWKDKSPLEKATARRDLFQLAVDQNPQIKSALGQADAAGKQKIFDDFDKDIRAKFPKAFQVPGYSVEKVGKNNYTAQPQEHSIGDAKSEAYLSMLDPRMTGKGDADRLKARSDLLAQLTPDQKKLLLPFAVQRYGIAGADGLGDVKDLFPEKSGLRQLAEVGIPSALRIGPVLIASPTKNPRIIAAASLLGEGMAESTEQMMGTRKALSPSEMGLNAALSLIPGISVEKSANSLVNTVKTAGARALEGATQGILFEGGRQILEGESDPIKQLTVGGFGAGLGGLLGGLEGRLAARFAGKSPKAILDDLPSVLEKATPEQKTQLTELQKRIEQMVGLDSRELAPATLVGVQEGIPGTQYGDTPLYNLTRDAAGTVQDSTVTRPTLEAAGYRVPETPRDLAPGQRVEIPLADLEPNAAASAETFQAAMDANQSPQAAAGLRQQLQEQAMRANDFPLARAEVAGEEIRANQLAGPEQRPAGLPPSDAQVTVMKMGDKAAVQIDIPNPEGGRPLFSGSPEQAAAAGYDFQLPSDIPEGKFTYDQLNPSAYESKTINDPEIKPSAGAQGQPRGVEEMARLSEDAIRREDEALKPLLSPQARTMYDTYGGIDPTLMRSLAAGGGAIGGFGYGFSKDKDAPLEERIKNGLSFAVLGAGGGYLAGRKITRLAEQSVPKTGKVELDTWYKRLGPEPKAPMSDARDLPNYLRRRLTTNMAAMDTIPRKIAEANNTPIIRPEVPLSRQLENVNGASGKAAVDVERFDSAVTDKISGESWKDFAVLISVKRAAQRLQQDINDIAEHARINAIPENLRTPAEKETLTLNPERRKVSTDDLVFEQKSLQQLEQKIGTDKFNELDQIAAGAMQQEMDKAMQLMVQSGRTSKEVYDATKISNDFYSPFDVLQSGEDYDGYAGMRANPIDTQQKYTQMQKGIFSKEFNLRDPVGVMREKIFQARILAEKNIKMNVLASYADQDASQTVIKKLGRGESAPRGMETVNYLENGVPKQLAVSPEIAEAVKGLNPAATGVISRFVGAVNKPFRFSATAGNIAFQGVNAPADLYRQAAFSTYGLGRGGVAETVRYPLDFVHALYSSIFSSPERAQAVGAVAGFYEGYDPNDPNRFRNAAVGAVVGGLAGRAAQSGITRGSGALRSMGGTAARAGEALDPTSLYRDFYQSGAAGSTMQDMIEKLASRKGATTIGQQVKSGPGVISTLQDFGRVVEETTKMLGIKRGLRQEGLGDLSKLSPQQAYNKMEKVVSETRNFAGSPDFAVGGDLVKDLNSAIVFLNPRIQGMANDAARLGGRDGAKAAAQAWTALGSTVGLAGAYLWARNHQKENEVDYAKVPPDEKSRYAMIPRYTEQGQPLYFTNDRGQKVREYYRIPLRDTAQNFYQMVQSSMDYAKSKDPQAVADFGAQLLENVSPINVTGRNTGERVESAIGGLGPVGTVPYMLATGRNPGLHRDIYRDDEMKKAAPQDQYTPNTPQVYRDLANVVPQFLGDPLRSPVMLEALTQAGVGGIVSQFTPQKPQAGRDETATSLQQSPLGRRFVRSSYVYEPAPDEARQAEQKQASQRTLEKNRSIELLTEFDATPKAERKAKYNALSAEDKATFADALQKRASRPGTEELGIIRGLGVENGARANYLMQRLDGMDIKYRKDFVKDLQDAKLVSPDVLKQMEFLLQAKSRRK